MRRLVGVRHITRAGSSFAAPAHPELAWTAMPRNDAHYVEIFAITV